MPKLKTRVLTPKFKTETIDQRIRRNAPFIRAFWRHGIGARTHALAGGGLRLLVVFDDNISDLYASQSGADGNLNNITVSSDSSIVKVGTISANPNIVAGSMVYAGVGRPYSPPQDFSAYDFVSAWVYNTTLEATNYVNITILSNAYGSMDNEWSLDFTDWREFPVRISTMSGYSLQKLQSVDDIFVYFRAPIAGPPSLNVRVDYVTLFTIL